MVSTETPARPPVAPPSDPGTAGGPSPRTVLLIGGALLLAIALVSVVAGMQAYLVYGGHEPAVRRAAHVVTGPLGSHRCVGFAASAVGCTATLDLVSGATLVTVRGAALGGDLYRVATPDNARAVPAVAEVHDSVQVQLVNVGGRGPSAVVIDLNRSVRWSLRLIAGATTVNVDLRDAPVSSVSFIGGASSIDLTLPRPTGTVPVRMAGGASQFAIHAPAGVPMRVRFGGGAGNATIDGATRTGIGAGTVIDADGWDAAGDRYDVDNTAGLSTLTVDRA